jgi:hypothetical protein
MFCGAIFFALFQFISCGIDTLNYLGPSLMPRSISQSPIGLIFSGPDNPSIPPYSGINLYYRIYISETEAINDRSRLEQRQSSNSVPGSAITSFLETTLRYVRPARMDSRAPPTIPSSFDSDSMRIELINGRLFLLIGDSSSYELKRNLQGLLYDFSILPVDEDSDFSNVLPNEPGQFLYVQFFAASYGFNFLGSNPELFSNAVFLGRIVLSENE